MNKKVLFAFLYLLVDVAWIRLMSSRFYGERIARIQCGDPMAFRASGAIGAYLLLLLTMFFVCGPLSVHYKGRYPSWFVFGIVGLCIYGVYNFTNYAILSRYPVSFVVVDTLWGLISFSTFGYLYEYLRLSG